jgi:hypothetical protein
VSSSTDADREAIRAAAAAEERAAILALVERAMRQLLHGADGAWVLEQLAEEIRRRGGRAAGHGIGRAPREDARPLDRAASRRQRPGPGSVGGTGSGGSRISPSGQRIAVRSSSTRTSPRASVVRT